MLRPILTLLLGALLCHTPADAFQSGPVLRDTGLKYSAVTSRFHGDRATPLSPALRAGRSRAPSLRGMKMQVGPGDQEPEGTGLAASLKMTVMMVLMSLGTFGLISGAVALIFTTAADDGPIDGQEVAATLSNIAEKTTETVEFVAPVVWEGVRFGVNDVVAPAAKFTAGTVIPEAQKAASPFVDQAVKSASPIVDPALKKAQDKVDNSVNYAKKSIEKTLDPAVQASNKLKEQSLAQKAAVEAQAAQAASEADKALEPARPVLRVASSIAKIGVETASKTADSAVKSINDGSAQKAALETADKTLPVVTQVFEWTATKINNGAELAEKGYNWAKATATEDVTAVKGGGRWSYRLPRMQSRRARRVLRRLQRT